MSLPNPPPPEPVAFAKEMEVRESRLPSENGAEGNDPNPPAEHNETSGDTSSRGDDERPVDNEPVDYDDLLRKAESADDSTEDEPEQTKSQVKAEARKGKRWKYEWATPLANIAILVLASWEMRLPVIHMDFIRLIECNKIPYFFAINLLPSAMTTHMTWAEKHLLTPPPPSPERLFAHVKRLGKLAKFQYGIAIPELNAAPVLWRAVRALLGTPYLYTLSKRLASVLDIPLTLHPDITQSLDATLFDSEKHMDRNPPEVSLISAVIIVIKLVYALDESHELSLRVDPNDPKFLMPKKQEWLENLRKHHDARCDTLEELLTPSSTLPAIHLSDPQIDALFTYAEEAFVPPVKYGGTKEPDMNPLELFHRFGPNPRPDKSHEDASEVESSAGPSEDTQLPSNRFPPTPPPPPHPAPTGPESREPRMNHPIYSRLDITGTFPPEYQLVVDIASYWSGFTVEEINWAIARLEQKILDKPMSLWKTNTAQNLGKNDISARLDSVDE
ncbi:uncharacterized protein EI90DRAFT_3034286, partial [Cantharellus anzutake]|uniref:uncharacterized protein n=1 Tax=Cantharellus anzutake TaxID=1750568 RepID=UPI0019050A5F